MAHRKHTRKMPHEGAKLLRYDSDGRLHYLTGPLGKRKVQKHIPSQQPAKFSKKVLPKLDVAASIKATLAAQVAA